MKHVDSFCYLEFENYHLKEIAERKIADLECKHVINFNSPKAKIIYNLGIESGFAGVIWGSTRNGTEHTEKAIINQMLETNFNRPLKIVVVKNNRIWADNTHTCIAQILRHGGQVKIKEVPFYIIDLSHKHPIIVNYNNSVLNSVREIKKAISYAYKIHERNEKGVRPNNITWNIKDLMKNSNIDINRV